VIPILQRDGFNVIAVQNPLSSLAGEVAWTRRVIEDQSGPVVVVGHSYGGAVITGAAAGNPNVRALVYIAAYAPDVGEPIGALNALFPPTALGTALTIDAVGFLYVDVTRLCRCHQVSRPVRGGPAGTPDAYSRCYAGAPRRDSLRGNARPGGLADDSLVFLVAREDQAINPDLERFMARRMGARTSEIRSSHVPFASHPNKVTELIEEAASAGHE